MLTCGLVSAPFQSHDIYVSPIGLKNLTLSPIDSRGVPNDVTYDPIDDQIYWIETYYDWTEQDGSRTCSSTSKIGRVDFEGGNQEYILSEISPGGKCTSFPKLALDVESRYVMWVSEGSSGSYELKKARLNGTDIRTLATGELAGHFTDISFDPVQRKVYWSHDSPSAVRRVNIDTAEVDVIIGNTHGITGVAVDSKDRQLYLTVKGADISALVQTTDLDGLNREYVYQTTDSTRHSPADIVSSNDDLYWIMAGVDKTGETNRNLYRMPKYNRLPSRVNTGLYVECLHIHENAPQSSMNPAIDKSTQRSPAATTSNSVGTHESELEPQYVDLPVTTSHNPPNTNAGVEMSSDKPTALPEGGFVATFTLIIVCLVVGIAILTSVIFFVARKIKTNPKKQRPLPLIVNRTEPLHHDYENGLVVRGSNVHNGIFQEKEINRKVLQLTKQLKSGVFGIAYEGFIVREHHVNLRVTIKTLKDDSSASQKSKFLDAIRLNLELGSHPNISTVIGCVTIEEPYCMVTEFMKHGNLLQFLQKSRQAVVKASDSMFNLTQPDQLHIARQIARGMEYLSRKRFYHGDLAARNILVGEGLSIKITGFGLVDDIYMTGQLCIEDEAKRAVKWVSLETNMRGVCTIQSDAWSYGIVLYEIYTLGDAPYPGMDNQSVIAKLQNGYRMEKPDNCPDQIYQMMRQCWQETPCDRPTFKSLVDTLDNMLEEDKNPALYSRTLSGEPDEHGLWQHLAGGNQSLQFVPMRDTSPNLPDNDNRFFT